MVELLWDWWINIQFFDKSDIMDLSFCCTSGTNDHKDMDKAQGGEKYVGLGIGIGWVCFGCGPFTLRKGMVNICISHHTDMWTGGILMTFEFSNKLVYENPPFLLQVKYILIVPHILTKGISITYGLSHPKWIWDFYY